MKPVSEHIPFLDYLRGLAILSVFFFHSLEVSFGTNQLPWIGYLRSGEVTRYFYVVFPAVFGFVGVPIFFAVSGFCIHLSHQRSRHKGYRIFFLRRFFRIYPPYLLALLFFALLFPFIRRGFGLLSHFSSAEDFVSHLFLIHNFSDTFFLGSINGSFWSIAVEAQLYMLYPLLLWLARYFGWQRALWITGLIELGLRGLKGIFEILYPHWNVPQYYTGSPVYYWFSWSMGAAVADAYLKGESLPFRNSLGFAWPILFIVCYFFKPLFPFTFTLASLSSTCLMVYLLNRPTFTPTFKGGLQYVVGHLRWTGIVSYSAYLIHQPLLNTVPRVVSWIFYHHPLSPLLLYGFCLSSWFPIFGLSYLFYRYVELPSIAWGKRVIDKSRKTISASDAQKAYQ